jgi:hypothetical protein
MVNSKRISGILIAGILVFGNAWAFNGISKGEKIVYSIRPVGASEYHDMGLVDYKGRKLWLVNFLTKVPGFRDLEKIYADPETGLPLVVERHIDWPLSKEFLIEEYDPQNNSQRIRRYVKGKLTNEYKYKAKAPYHNAILLPFYLRRVKNLKIGWTMVVRFPNEFVVTLENIEYIKVRGKMVATYHFISNPNKFEIWISKDKNLLPVVIKGTAGYSMFLQSYSSQEKAKNK